MKLITTIFLVFLSTVAFAQTDSTKKLNEVLVKGYYNPQPLLRATGAVNILDSNQFKNQQNSSLVSVINSSPGVRMEERSPGSYRLSLRGSLLRSPFGIRNIRIYIADFPLTDAGGNTYLNSLDVAAVGRIEIFKGPEASTFGANTGGAILISPMANEKSAVSFEFTAASYGLLHQSATIQQKYTNYSFSITQAYQQSDGYRENSALKRKYIQTLHEWDYNAKGKLKAFVLYSDLGYETPGGLTSAQLALNPRSARPATPTLPSAIQQQAAIYNKTFYAGLSNSYSFNSHFKHIIALFTSTTDFKNPFITNFEKRKENTVGLRTFVEYNTIEGRNNYRVQAGIESASTKTDIDNFNNDKGIATTMQAADDLTANQDFGFLRLNFDFNQRLLVELGASLNFFSYSYAHQFPLPIIDLQRQSFKKKLMPKIAASYLFSNIMSLRGSVSKGYSPPTLAEIRSSDNRINSNLQAEAGWNYETGVRFQSNNKRFYIDANLFYFHLKDAIVRGLNANDTEYFINAGGTKQLGTEIQGNWLIIQNSTTQFLNSLQLRSSFTYSHFKFEAFKNAQQDYSGNYLTGVPKHTVVSSLDFNFTKGIYLFLQHNYTATIPLNDSNTIYANRYHLIDLRSGINGLHFGKIKFDISLGVNNLFDQNYSLGNDLNAANNRYFNAAAGVNYDAGLKIKIN